MVKGSRSIYHIRRTWQLKDLDQAPYVDVISYVWEPFGTKSTRPNSTLLLSSAGFSTVNLNTSPQTTGFLASPPASQPSSGASPEIPSILSLPPSASVVFALSSVESSVHIGTVLAITEYNTHP